MVRSRYSMIYCHVCHKPMSAEAPVCSACGQPNPYAKAIKDVNSQYKYLIPQIITIILCGYAIYCIYNQWELIKLSETIQTLSIPDDIRTWRIRMVICGALMLLVEVGILIAKHKNKKYFKKLDEWYQDNKLFVPPDKQFNIYN